MFVWVSECECVVLNGRSWRFTCCLPLLSVVMGGERKRQTRTVQEKAGLSRQLTWRTRGGNSCVSQRTLSLSFSLSLLTSRDHHIYFFLFPLFLSQSESLSLSVTIQYEFKIATTARIYLLHGKFVIFCGIYLIYLIALFLSFVWSMASCYFVYLLWFIMQSTTGLTSDSTSPSLSLSLSHTHTHTHFTIDNGKQSMSMCLIE